LLKIAIVILSDGNSNSDEALGRLFNGLIMANEAHEMGAEICILFMGTGVRWLTKISRLEHPANKLYETVKQLISGASCGCAEVFGATEELEASGFDLVEESFIQSEVGVPSLYSRIKSGYQIVTF
jgi:predicted peroxiredoxin